MKEFLSFKDDDNKIIRGYFEIDIETENYIRFRSEDNLVTIPWNRVLKFKRKLEKMKGGSIKI